MIPVTAQINVRDEFKTEICYLFQKLFLHLLLCHVKRIKKDNDITGLGIQVGAEAGIAPEHASVFSSPQKFKFVIHLSRTVVSQHFLSVKGTADLFAVLPVHGRLGHILHGLLKGGSHMGDGIIQGRHITLHTVFCHIHPAAEIFLGG